MIGVAKRPFYQNVEAIAVTRGRSRRPLFVTAIGIDPRQAAAGVQSMHGNFRMPTLLKLVDALSKNKPVSEDS